MIKRARPTVLIANENFVEALVSIATASGVPDLPYVVFPTNIDSLPEEEIAALTDERLDEIADKLLHRKAAAPAHAQAP